MSESQKNKILEIGKEVNALKKAMRGMFDYLSSDYFATENNHCDACGGYISPHIHKDDCSFKALEGSDGSKTD